MSTHRTPAQILSAFADNPIEAKALQKILNLWGRMQRLFLVQQDESLAATPPAPSVFWARANLYSALVVERLERAIGSRTDLQETQDYLARIKAWALRHRRSHVKWAIYDAADMPIISLLLPHHLAYRMVPSFHSELPVTMWAIDLVAKMVPDRFWRPMYAGALVADVTGLSEHWEIEAATKRVFQSFPENLLLNLEARDCQRELLIDLIECNPTEHTSDRDLYEWWRCLPLGSTAP